MRGISPKKKSEKKKKEEEFEKINWKNNFNPDIQMCILLYDDRVNSYHRMHEIDKLIDEQPSLAAELVELDIRNQQAHRELKSYNDAQKFINEHPLVQEFNLRQKSLSDYKILKKNAPCKLMNEITNLQQNIRRVESNLRTKKYKTEDERKTWEDNLQRLKIKSEILEKIISE